MIVNPGGACLQRVENDTDKHGHADPGECSRQPALHPKKRNHPPCQILRLFCLSQGGRDLRAKRTGSTHSAQPDLGIGRGNNPALLRAARGARRCDLARCGVLQRLCQRDIDDWLELDEPNADATVINEAALAQYPFIKTLRMPTNWHELSDKQANDLMDPFA